MNKGFKAGERRPEPRLEGNDKNRRQVWPVIHPQTGRMGSIWRWPQTRKVQWAVAILAAVVSALVFLDILEPNKENQNPGSVGMTRIDASSGKGLIEVPLVAVEKNKLVSFEYQRLDGPVPLLAYRTPSGKIVTAVGFSEPCNSRSFHIEGNDIVCNLCLTRWNLETLEGGKGDCPQYPPDRLMHTVHEGRLIIREMDVQYWKPRPFPRTEEHPTV